MLRFVKHHSLVIVCALVMATGTGFCAPRPTNESASPHTSGYMAKVLSIPVSGALVERVSSNGGLKELDAVALKKAMTEAGVADVVIDKSGFGHGTVSGKALSDATPITTERLTGLDTGGDEKVYLKSFFDDDPEKTNAIVQASIPYTAYENYGSSEYPFQLPVIGVRYVSWSITPLSDKRNVTVFPVVVQSAKGEKIDSHLIGVAILRLSAQ